MCLACSASPRICIAAAPLETGQRRPTPAARPPHPCCSAVRQHRRCRLELPRLRVQQPPLRRAATQLVRMHRLVNDCHPLEAVEQMQAPFGPQPVCSCHLPACRPEPDASTQQQLAGLVALPPGFAQVRKGWAAWKRTRGGCAGPNQTVPAAEQGSARAASSVGRTAGWKSACGTAARLSLQCNNQTAGWGERGATG